MNDLLPFEVAVLKKLLDGGHPVLQGLMRQIDRAKIESREYSGAGFFLNFNIDEALALPGGPNFTFGDVAMECSSVEHGIGFLIFVRNGVFLMLEGYTYAEDWPQEIKNFKLHYIVDGKPSEQRDMQAFERTIS
jgi:hypothetical protein